jgi:hypothetical protein
MEIIYKFKDSSTVIISSDPTGLAYKGKFGLQAGRTIDSLKLDRFTDMRKFMNLQVRLFKASSAPDFIVKVIKLGRKKRRSKK